MNTFSTSQDPSGQPAPAARRLRRPRLLRRAALAVTCLAGVGGLMLAASGSAFAVGLDQTSPQWAEIGPWGYTDDQSSDVTAVYTIQNVAELGTQMLQDRGNSMDNGGTVDMWSQVYQTTNQDNEGNGPYGPITQANYLWEFVPSNPANGPSIVDGPGELINRQSGLCLDILNNNTANNAAIDQWTCNGGSNQQWGATPVSDGNYEITSVLDGNGSALGIGTQSTCILAGDGDSVSVYTTDQYNTCEWWNIKQASYDFATYPVGVPDGATGVTDGRGYECVPGDVLRGSVTANPYWDYNSLGQAYVYISHEGPSPAQYIPGSEIGYYSADNPVNEIGQILLYCDPPTQTP